MADLRVVRSPHDATVRPDSSPDSRPNRQICNMVMGAAGTPCTFCENGGIDVSVDNGRHAEISGYCIKDVDSRPPWFRCVEELSVPITVGSQIYRTERRQAKCLEWPSNCDSSNGQAHGLQGAVRVGCRHFLTSGYRGAAKTRGYDHLRTAELDADVQIRWFSGWHRFAS